MLERPKRSPDEVVVVVGSWDCPEVRIQPFQNVLELDSSFPLAQTDVVAKSDVVAWLLLREPLLF